MQEDDDNQNLVLGILFGIIALVVGLVIGLSVYVTGQNRAPAPVAAVVAEEPEIAEVGEALAIGSAMICISEHGHFPARTVVGDFSEDEAGLCCRQMDCRNCFVRSRQPLSEQAARHSLVVLPIGDSSGWNQAAMMSARLCCSFG